MPPKKMPPVRLASSATSHDDILHPPVAREPALVPSAAENQVKSTIRTESIVHTIRTESPDEEKPLRIPFTNNLPPAVFREWFTYAYMARLPLQDVLERALTTYLHDKPQAREPLPPEQESILAAKEEAELNRRQKRRTK
ncbi:hypothetical protein FNT36_23850 [Hymenobacter setariae]|jgi:hypothetical protein|uniref:Uncharacterized protein n=1 Tax=Hymenobacter setariae TaxID=2594794 RepID=A0A558BK68_9BACT|nr:hypothetical protein [Hymenobacter setariae]TVT36907.1 hypothetical protein FNT36_23850 [Hymenobacter setariae]